MKLNEILLTFTDKNLKINKDNLNSFLNDLNYDILSLKDIVKLLKQFKKHNLIDKLNSKSIIKLFHNIDKKVIELNDKSEKYYINDEIIYIIQTSSYNTKKDVLQYFIDNKKYNIFVIYMYLYSSNIFEEMILPNTFIDKFIQDLIFYPKYLEYIQSDLDYYIAYIIDNDRVFEDSYLVQKLNNNKILENITNKKLKDIILYIQYFFKVKQMINSRNIEEVFSKNFIKEITKYSDYDDFIYKFLEMLDNKKKLPDNILLFLDKLNKSNILNELNENYYILKIKLLFNNVNDLDKFLENLDILDNIENIKLALDMILKEKEIIPQNRIVTLSILSLCLLNIYNKHKDVIDYILFNSSSSNYMLISLVNCNKMLNNLDNLDISDKNKYNLLKFFKNIDKDLYRNIVNKANIKISEFKQLINIIEMD